LFVEYWEHHVNAGFHAKRASFSRAHMAERRAKGKVRTCIFPAEAGVKESAGQSYSTFTLFARLRGWSTSVPLMTAVW
jgi:hypothetical protein